MPYISTHAPRARCDVFISQFSPPAYHISTHAPRARCDKANRAEAKSHPISTHAPRARCDVIWRTKLKIQSISTHAPRARCDVGPWKIDYLASDFNSRTSCEVRLCAIGLFPAAFYFNSRTSCEVRPQDLASFLRSRLNIRGGLNKIIDN